MTQNQRKKFQIYAAEKQKARPPCCFLLKVRMRKVLSSEKECRRDVDLDTFSQVLRGNASDDLIACKDKLLCI